jgi:hypothetical protein
MGNSIASWPLKTKVLAMFGSLVVLYLVFFSRVLVGYVRVAAEARSINQDTIHRNPGAALISLRLSRDSEETFRAVFRNNGPKTLSIVHPANLTNKHVFDAWGRKTPWSGMVVLYKSLIDRPLRHIVLAPGTEIAYNIHQSRCPDGVYPPVVGRLMFVSYESLPTTPNPLTAPRIGLARVSICSNVVFL